MHEHAANSDIQPVNHVGGSVQSARSFSLPQSLDFSHLLQPEPVAFPRKILDQRFAVLLLRSTYEAVDALDFIAMVLHELQPSVRVPFALMLHNFCQMLESFAVCRINFRYSSGKPDRPNMNHTCCSTAQSECARYFPPCLASPASSLTLSCSSPIDPASHLIINASYFVQSCFMAWSPSLQL